MSIMEKKPKSIMAEAYRGLRTNIAYSSFDSKYQIISVTSATPGEGKSTTALNLAVSLAQSENKVLLVDCDVRKPSLHKKMGISNVWGLTDLLTGKKNMDISAKETNKNLTVLTSGTIPPNPAEMLASKVMSDFLEESRKHYDYIILDTSPLQAVTDAQILSTKADGTLIVVKANDTKKEDVVASVDMIKKVNGKIMGIVLNGVKDNKKKYHYYE